MKQNPSEKLRVLDILKENATMTPQQEAQKLLDEAKKQAQIVLDRASIVAERLVLIQANTDKDIALIQQSMAFVRSEVAEIKDLLKVEYVTRAEFLPIKVIVYTVTSVAGVGAVGALLKLILK